MIVPLAIVPVLAAERTSPRTAFDELARFFGYSHDLLLILDHGGNVLMASPSVERVLGLRVETLVERSFLRWIHPNDRLRVRARARSLASGDPIAELPARVRRLDGQWVPMSWSLAPGEHGRLYAVGRDQTAAVREREAMMGRVAAELRLRTAAELHDGILQNLTAASLQVAVARNLVREKPEQAERVLDALLEAIVTEQREIRLYVDEIKDDVENGEDPGSRLGERLGRVVANAGVSWGVRTTVDVRLAEPMPAEMGRQILRICQEATVNAARHGGATQVSVEVWLEQGEVVVAIADDGKGFSAIGDFDDEALARDRMGPVSLKHRIDRAGGRLAIRSSRQGSRIVAHLPLGGAGTP